MPKIKSISNRERVALFALAAGQIINWREAYIIANQNPENDVKKQTALNSTVSRWKGREEIQTAYKTAVAAVVAMKASQAEETQKQAARIDTDETGPGDSERTETKKGRPAGGPVDYSDPAQQTRKLNELVNTATDPGEALDALKVIIQSQRADREAAREGRRVQFYTPLRCRDCPLYAKARAKRDKAL